MPQMRRRDWILTLLAAADDCALTPVQLQKTLFLLQREKPNLVGKGFYRFVPYAYGPFDRTVYQDAEALVAEGSVAIEPTPYGHRKYVATARGLHHIRKMTRFDTLQREVADTLKWVQGRSFSKLVSDIYKAYPEMRVNSIFR